MSPDRDRPLKRVFDSQWFISALRFARWPRRTMNRPAETAKPGEPGYREHSRLKADLPLLGGEFIPRLLRRRSAGLWAFMLHRLSGIGLVVYLYLHLAVLNELRGGPERWDAFVALARSPLFLMLDVILLGGVLIHSLNGLRLTLLGFGRGLRWQMPLFWASLTLAVVLTAWGALAMFGR